MSGGGTPQGQTTGDCGTRPDLSPPKTHNGSQATPAGPQAITEATGTESYRDLLVALRLLIAGVIDDGCSPRDLVGLSRRLLDISSEIVAMDARDKPGGSRPVEDGIFDPESV